MTIFYDDISSYDGGMIIPATMPLVVAKATEGIYYHDADYMGFAAQCKAKGIPFSAYHFLKSESSPEAQAAYYHDFAGNTPCMLDVETEGGSRPGVDWVLRFMTALKGLGGVVWAVYYPRWYWALTGGDLSAVEAAGAVLVASEYRAYNDNDWPLPYGGATPVIWQYTSSPHDTNAFKGTPVELAALLSGDNVTPEDVYNYGKESVTLANGTVMQNVPFGNLAHGAWVGINDPKIGANAKLDALAAQVAALTAMVSKLVPGGSVDPVAVADAELAEIKAKL